MINRDYRSMGIGKHLVNEAIKIVKKLGYNELFLSTYLINYYDKLGWMFVKYIPDENGRDLRLYKYDLSNFTENFL